jgi:aspartyl/asparaginyl beta-hydroxylase (cupin superfamily)
MNRSPFMSFVLKERVRLLEGGMDLPPDNSSPTLSTLTTAAACIIGVVVIAHQLRSKRTSDSMVVHSNACNDPNCLRCHFSSHHIETFRRNATLLRRLTKLEPGIFDGMRGDIWTVVEDMERRHVAYDEETGLQKLKRWLSWRAATTYQQAEPISKEQASTVQLSPQAGQEPTVFFLPNLEAVPFHHADKCHKSCPCIRLWKRQPIDPKSAPIYTTGDIEMLQQNVHIIKTELDNLLATNKEQFASFDSAVYTATNQSQNTQAPEWSSIYLFHQGVKQSACNKHFPQTTNIIETSCPNRMAGKCGLGSIYFSKLKNNTRVTEHHGPTNVRWRCHIPLIVPSECNESRLSVGVGANEESIGWQEGKPILFDDSFLHSAIHMENYSGTEGDSSRIVLIIDFWHPALSEADRTAIGVLYPPGS